MKKRHTTEQFEIAAKKVHGEKYDYSQVDYKNAYTKVKIICKKHGLFEKTPSNHLIGSGCKKCFIESKTKTTEQFIQESILLHGDKYDYSQVDYKNGEAKVKIICKKHGLFEQMPSSHVNGQGCKKCGVESKTKTTEQFIQESILLHGDAYDYSLVDYKNSITKVKIICKKHGLFEQIPMSHSRGERCRECYRESRTKNTEQFIEKSKLKHGDTYDYSQINYKNSITKVKIICKKHGLFERTPSLHLQGYGCGKCTKKTKFIVKSIKVHGDAYDYSQVDYKNGYTKVKIICKKHGLFEQLPISHLCGNRCKKCYHESLILSQEEFIEKSKLKHGDTYDYSLVDYKNSITKVKIICKKHGMFEQRPTTHLKGSECKKCAFEKTTSLGEKEFLDELNIPESDRQFVIPSASYIADGIHKSTNTILEYLGDYWHGNPSRFAPSKKIFGTSKTCADVYKETFNRFAIIKSLGYNVKYIWESDWQAWKKNPDDPIPIKQF